MIGPEKTCSDSSCHLEIDSMTCRYDLLMTYFLPLPARYTTLAEVQCSRSFSVVHHGNWFAPVRWRLGIRKQHQNGVVSPFLQLCQKLTIQAVKRDRTDHRCWTLCWKSGAWDKVQHWILLVKTNGKTCKIPGLCEDNHLAAFSNCHISLMDYSGGWNQESVSWFWFSIIGSFMIHLTFWGGPRKTLLTTWICARPRKINEAPTPKSTLWFKEP